MRLLVGLVAATLGAGCATGAPAWPTARITAAADDGGESLAPRGAAVGEREASPDITPVAPEPEPARAVPAVAPATVATPIAEDPPIVEEITIHVND